MATQHYTRYATLPDGQLALDYEQLRVQGPVLPVLVGVDRRRAEALSNSGQPIPAPVNGLILVDTGASATCIDLDAIAKLGLASVGDCEINTPTSSESRKIYPCSLAFQGTTLPSIPELFVIGCDLKKQGIIGLLGRDYLGTAVLVFSGPGASWSISV